MNCSVEAVLRLYFGQATAFAGTARGSAGAVASWASVTLSAKP